VFTETVSRALQTRAYAGSLPVLGDILLRASDGYARIFNDLHLPRPSCW
jgi:hypothetical protein